MHSKWDMEETNTITSSRDLVRILILQVLSVNKIFQNPQLIIFKRELVERSNLQKFTVLIQLWIKKTWHNVNVVVLKEDIF